MIAAFLLVIGAALTAAPFPPVLHAPDNPPSSAKFELGRRLFYDKRISGNGTQSCASCHQQSRAFTDGRAVAVGSTGQHHTKNVQTLTNVAYNASFTWTGTRIRSLEKQALVPMFGTKPVELGVRELVKTLSGDPAYVRAFAEAFPGERKPVSIRNVTRAIAVFERGLVSWQSPYDDFVYRGEPMSPSAMKGMDLFYSKRAKCSSCHEGFNLSGPVRRARAEVISNGVTEGKFRVPTLRNVELTAPYMHDGSAGTLEEVVARYDRARMIGLDAGEQRDLVAFLRALTDMKFVSDPRFSEPLTANR